MNREQKLKLWALGLLAAGCALTAAWVLLALFSGAELLRDGLWLLALLTMIGAGLTAFAAMAADPRYNVQEDPEHVDR